MIKLYALLAAGLLGLGASCAWAGDSGTPLKKEAPSAEAPLKETLPPETSIHESPGPVSPASCCPDAPAGGHPRLHRLVEWAAYQPLDKEAYRDCCHCTHGCCTPPLYMYFMGSCPSCGGGTSCAASPGCGPEGCASCGEPGKEHCLLKKLFTWK
jgi:hypothetical protein